MGSPLYMSPEQMRSSKDVDARSDIWALGTVLYEALAGAPPFDGETVTALIIKITQDAATPGPPAAPGHSAAARGRDRGLRSRRIERADSRRWPTSPRRSPPSGRRARPRPPIGSRAFLARRARRAALVGEPRCARTRRPRPRRRKAAHAVTGARAASGESRTPLDRWDPRRHAGGRGDRERGSPAALARVAERRRGRRARLLAPQSGAPPTATPPPRRLAGRPADRRAPRWPPANSPPSRRRLRLRECRPPERRPRPRPPSGCAGPFEAAFPGQRRGHARAAGPIPARRPQAAPAEGRVR